MFLEAKPSNKSKKGGTKGTVALSKESTQLICVSQDSSEKVYSAERRMIDQMAASNSPRTPGTKLIFGKEWVHHKELSKSANLMNAVLARQNSGEDHMRKPCTKKDAPAEKHGL